MTQIHTIDPVYDKNSRVLILGSFPSVKSRETEFFYGHPQNRFWRVLAGLLELPVPENIEQKRLLLLENKIALWDVIQSCEITGSDDASIKNVVPNDLSPILTDSDIKQIFTNGGAASRLYEKILLPETKLPAISLPSTSPANARFSLEKLMQDWRVILDYI